MVCVIFVSSRLLACNGGEFAHVQNIQFFLVGSCLFSVFQCIVQTMETTSWLVCVPTGWCVSPLSHLQPCVLQHLSSFYLCQVHWFLDLPHASVESLKQAEQRTEQVTDVVLGQMV